MRPGLLPLLALLSIACHTRVADADAPPARPAPGEFRDVRTVAAGSTVQLSGWSGAVEATGTDGDTLDVRGVFTGADASRMKVVVRQDAAGVAVCVLHADEPAERCRLGEIDRGQRYDHLDADVRLVARVPRGVRLVAETLNGGVAATGMTAEVRASTLNGDVVVSTSGPATARTANGAIDATVGAAPASGELRFETTNGRVHVALPAGIDADVEASTLNGAIRANFPITVEGTPYGGPRQGRARLGKGGRRVLAHTTNGEVDLRTGS